jgi:hypothetical protein
VGASGDRLKQQAGKLLAHGEFLVAAGRFAGPRAAEQTTSPDGRPFPEKLALAVTDRRVLVLRLGARERVVETTHSIPLRSITDVRSDADAKAVHVTLAFHDGSTVAMTAGRPNNKDGEEVARALATALARR